MNSMTRRSNRRDFLKGRVTAEALADAISPDVAEAISKASPPETPFVLVTRRAMATEFELRFPDDPQKNLTELALESFKELEKVEEQLSFFRPTSEISRINLLAAQQPVEVEPALFALLILAKQLAQETGGAWDLTAAPLWQVWGFAKRKGKIPTEAEIAAARNCIGSQYVELDAERKTIFFTQPGVKLNFGSLGKGYALDRCTSRLIEGGMTNFVLHGGQSSMVARGGEKAEENAPVPFFSVGLPHPLYPNRRLGEIRLSNKALGTSSSRFQSFRHEGKLFGHILDPRTGRPAEGVLSTTVLAPTAMLADVLSTAFFVLGAEKSLEYCKNHPEISAIILLPSSVKGGCEIITAGLKAEEFQRF
jgi:thiamine biosynthesis lipoprotein